jgi:hypothetical protein
MQNAPYALIRDLLAFRFQIQENDRASAVRAKLEKGIGEALGADPMRAHVIGQWLGFDFSDSPHLAGVLDDAQQLRDRAMIYLSEFFQATAEQAPTVIFMEDIHWADDSSLDVIDYLARATAERRMLVLCLARPTLFERRPGWGSGQGPSAGSGQAPSTGSGQALVFRQWAEMEEGLSYVTYLKVDRAEAELLTGQSDLELAARQLARYGPREVILTQTSGVTVLAEDHIYQAPFTPRSLAGRTGRGDTCFATYLGKRLSGSPEDATRFAAAVTTLKQEQPGPWRGTIKDVQTLMAS